MLTFPMTLFAGGEEPFDPLIDGAASALLVWYDASDGATVLDSGGSPVTSSGSAYNLTDKKASNDLDDYDTVSELPTYDPGNASYQANGKDGLVFTQDGLQTGTGSGEYPTYTDAKRFSTVVCLKMTANNPGNSPIGQRIGSSTRAQFQEGFGNGTQSNTLSAAQGSYPSSATGGVADFTTSMDTTNAHVCAQVADFRDTSAGQAFTNRVWYDDPTTYADTELYNWPHISGSYNRICIGGPEKDSAADGSSFIFFEMLVYDGEISDDDRTLAMNYMKTKYGIS